MSAPLRVLAEPESYDDLIVALRTRADELEMTRIEIDRLSGLSDGYAGKLLCRPPMKGLGKMSLEIMTKALGVRLIVIEDTEQTAKILSFRMPRERPIRKEV